MNWIKSWLRVYYKVVLITSKQVLVLRGNYNDKKTESIKNSLFNFVRNCYFVYFGFDIS